MDSFTSTAHVTTFSERLYYLRQINELCDLRLTSNFSSLDLHKVVLASMTDTALAKVKSAEVTSGVSMVKVRDCSMDVLSAVAEFLYFGILRFNKDTLECLLGVLEDVGVGDVVRELKNHRFLSVAGESSSSPSLALSRGRRSCRSTWSTVDVRGMMVNDGLQPVTADWGRPAARVTRSGRETNKQTESAGAAVNRRKGRPKRILKDGSSEQPAKKKKRKQVHDESVLVEIDEQSQGTETPEEDDSDHDPDWGIKEPNSKLSPKQAAKSGRRTQPNHQSDTGKIQVKEEGGGEGGGGVDGASGEEDEHGGLVTREEGKSGRQEKKIRPKTVIVRSKTTQCYRCKEEFATPQECAQHRTACKAEVNKTPKAVRQALPFLCRRCWERFRTQEELNVHQTSCQVKRKRIERKCRKCQIDFDDLEKLKAHRKMHEREWNRQYKRVKKVLNCELCDYKSTSEKTLLFHMTRKHNQPLTGTEKHPLLYCQVEGCHFRTLYGFQMTNHMDIHNDARTFICEICGKAYKQKSVLDIHMKTVHSDASQDCPECCKRFKTKVALKSHIDRVHLRVKDVKCEHCDFTTYDKTTMESHQYSKHNIPYPSNRKCYECELCGYITRWRCQFNTHMRRHKGECPFRCKVCGKGFPAKSDLTSHAKWHFEKQFKCSFENCKFSTCAPGKLQDHIRTMHTHRDEKPFECHICNYRTNLRGNLLLHLRKVHKLTVQTRQKRVARDAGKQSVSATQEAVQEPIQNTVEDQDQAQTQVATLEYTQVPNQVQPLFHGAFEPAQSHEQNQNQDLNQSQNLGHNQGKVDESGFRNDGHFQNVPNQNTNMGPLVSQSQPQLSLTQVSSQIGKKDPSAPKTINIHSPLLSGVEKVAYGEVAKVKTEDTTPEPALTGILAGCSEPQTIKNTVGSQQKPVVLQIRSDTLHLLQKQLQQQQQQQQLPVQQSQSLANQFLSKPTEAQTLTEDTPGQLLLNPSSVLNTDLYVRDPSVSQDMIAAYSSLLQSNFGSFRQDAALPSVSLGEGRSVQPTDVGASSSSAQALTSDAQSAIVTTLPLSLSEGRLSLNHQQNLDQ